jgi:ribosomal protein L29
MKKNQIKEIIEQGQGTISAKIAELQKAHTEHQLKVTRGEVKNLRATKVMRRTIARLKTALSVLKLQDRVKESK